MIKVTPEMVGQRATPFSDFDPETVKIMTPGFGSGLSLGWVSVCCFVRLLSFLPFVASG